MVINTNIGANRTSRLLEESTQKLNGSLSRLASGSKIIEPQDDAAGLAVATKFDATISRNRAVQDNVANALSFSQTQDGFLQKVSKALDRMGELMMLANNPTTDNSQKDWEKYAKEYVELESYISDIGTKDFNGVSLFNGTGLSVTKDSEGNTWNLNSVQLNDSGGDLYDLFTNATQVVNGVDAWGFSSYYLDFLKASIEDVAASRAKVGANIRRLEYTGDQLSTLNENLSASISRIKDVDVAAESTRFARYNILTQSGTVMLAQANLVPQNALRLLQ